MKLLIPTIVLFLVSNFALAQHYKVLHSFSGPPYDASYVISSLAFDSKGNLYGTSANGGDNTDVQGEPGGTVFELTPNGDGTWSESVIYNFCSNFNGALCLDGETSWAGLVVDKTGNLYGTTYQGGSNCTSRGCGVVFELSPQGGTWTETVLYNFCSNRKNGLCLDGGEPAAPMIFGADGGLYGTALIGGSGHFPKGDGGGVVFKLTPGSHGWADSVLYNFCSTGSGMICPDGDSPYLAGVAFGRSGNLYGTTQSGGSNKNEGTGVVYELAPGSGGWQEKVLAIFPSPNLFTGIPSGGVAIDPLGNLYGSFEFPKGGVFDMNPKTKQKKVFLFDGADGEQPIGGVTLDLKHSVLYGTTSGVSGGVGGIYKIDATGKETLLYQFCSQQNCADGFIPWATMIQDKNGNLYGTTQGGGEFGNGVVFEYTP